MEAVSLSIKKFLDSGSGAGEGWGSGYGDGSGAGAGYGYKIEKYQSHHVFYIDGIPTVIVSSFGNYAKGFMITTDSFEKADCYIAKNERGDFAHGKTLREAADALFEKEMAKTSVDERIDLFLEKFKKGQKYQGSDFFEWHHLLTGSCRMGRETFCKEHNLSLDDEYTVDDFIRICENAYGSEIIKELKEKWR